MRRAVFLDLGGTLALPLKPARLDELTLIPGAAEAIARLTEADFVCPVVTVQSRIAKGLFTMAEFEAWFEGLTRDLERHHARIVGPYVCPHRFAHPCPCKKPTGLLYRRAAADYGLDVARSFVIGDSPDDMRAARAIGARGCWVRTGWAADPAVAEAAAPDTAFVAESLGAAVGMAPVRLSVVRDAERRGF